MRRTSAILIVVWLAGCGSSANSTSLGGDQNGGNSLSLGAQVQMLCQKNCQLGVEVGCGSGDCTSSCQRVARLDEHANCLGEELTFQRCVAAQPDICDAAACEPAASDAVDCYTPYCMTHPADSDCPRPPAPSP
jgi:hypothetical protein